MSKYYKAEEQEIKLSDRVFDMSADGNFYPHELQGGWDIDESGPRWYKVLDQQDIEELGWTYKGNHYFYKQDEWYEMPCDEYSNYYLHKYDASDTGRVGYTIIQASPGGYSLQGDDLFKFDGEIRNYNELKFIMARTGIKRKDE